MKNRFTKYGFMIIAAVLLVALAFAGAASADGYTVTLNTEGSGTTDPTTVTGSFTMYTTYGDNTLILHNGNPLDGTSIKATPNSGYAVDKWKMGSTELSTGTTGPISSGTFTAVFVPAVAEINGVGYATVEAAFEAATAGQTIKLLKDSTLSGEITVGETVTLDLNGKVLTAASKNRLFLAGDEHAPFTGTFTIVDNGASDTPLVYQYHSNAPWEKVAVDPSSAVDIAAFNLTEAIAQEDDGYYVKVFGGALYGGNGESDGGGAVKFYGGTFKMMGGNIVGCTASSGGAVDIDKVAGSFIMDGGNIVGCSAECGGGVKLILEDDDYGTSSYFTMTGGSIIGCSASESGGGVYSSYTAEITMTGGSITGCSARGTDEPGYGGGVYLSGYNDEPGTFNMVGGTITQCVAKDNGGAVYVSSKSSFTMKKTDGVPSPIISKCSAMNGGGISLEGEYDDRGETPITNFATFSMEGGTITECKATGNGGAVYASKYSTFTMGKSDGTTSPTISKCSAGYNGGGVYLNAESSTFTIYNGLIQDCKATDVDYGVGGGVNVNNGTFEIYSGKITGCESASDYGGAAVYLGGGNLLLKGGSALVDATNDVCLGYDEEDGVYQNIEVIGTFTPSSLSGFGVKKIALEHSTSLGVWKDQTVVKNGAGYKDYFTLSSESAYSSYRLAAGTGGQANDLVLKEGYKITYVLNGGTNHEDNPSMYSPSDLPITLEDASKTGHTFDGWYENAGFTGNPITTIPSGSTGAKTFYAKFTANVTKVTFDYGTLSPTKVDPMDFTYGTNVTDEIPEYLTKEGYTFHWQESVSDKDITPTYVNETGIWVYPNGGELTFNGKFIVITDPNVPVSGGIATFKEKDCAALITPSKVTKVQLLSVSGLSDGTYATFIADNETVPVPTKPGYTETGISRFQINAVVDSSEIPATIMMKLTLADKNDKDKIRFWHYNTAESKWDDEALIATSSENADGTITYDVETDSFSPFAITLETKNSSGSSHQGGSRILPATDAPTVTPTQQPTTDATPLTPTVKPTQQPTQKSPAPLAGLVLGLGAAALIYRMRQ